MMMMIIIILMIMPMILSLNDIPTVGLGPNLDHANNDNSDDDDDGDDGDDDIKLEDCGRSCPIDWTTDWLQARHGINEVVMVNDDDYDDDYDHDDSDNKTA